jgi:DNA adenine methylase
MKTPFKAVGGKSWLLPKIKPIWDKHENRRWFDPFVGGGGLPLSLRPKKAYLSDANMNLMFAYMWVREFEDFKIPYSHNPDFYYGLRKEFNNLNKDPQATVGTLGEMFFRLNRSCYRGLWRVNKKGDFNSPWGHYKKFSEIDLYHWKEIFSNPEWVFRLGNGIESTLLWVEKDDFIFLDPPYLGTFDGYTKEGFGWDDHVKLVDLVSDHKGPIVICNSVDPRLVNLYEREGFNVEIIPAKQKLKPECQKFEIFATKNI